MSRCHFQVKADRKCAGFNLFVFSRPRGVAKFKSVFPMVRGKHICLCLLPSVGRSFLLFCEISAAIMPLFHVLQHLCGENVNFDQIATLAYVDFASIHESDVPTLAGKHTFEVDFPEVNFAVFK